MDTKKLCQKILDLAIRGKLVPQDPNDEPASLLLEQIRAEKEYLIKGGTIKRNKCSVDKVEIDVPFEIPDSWVWTTLGEISNYGITTNIDVKDIPQNTWVLELEDLEKDSARIIKRITKSEREIKGVRHSFKKGDVLYSKLRTYLNKVLVAPEDGYCTTEIIPISFPHGVHSTYLNHVLRSNYFLNYTIQCGYGVKMPRLSTNDASKGQVPLPPLNEQKRIVTAIEQWFSLIDILENEKSDLQASIQQAKSKILDLAIHGKLVPQDLNDEPAIELLKRINPKFEPCDDKECPFVIPQNWEWATIEDVCDVARGGSPRPIKDYLTEDDNGVNWIKIGDTEKNGKYINSAKERIKPEGISKSRFVRKGDFLLTNSMSFGHPFILNIDGCIHDGWLVISPLENAFTADFLYYLLSSIFVYEQFSEAASGGVVSNLNSDKVARTIIPLPPIYEQLRIVAKIEELFAILDDIKKSLV